MALRPARVLVVDDERHISRLIEFVLSKEGYEVKLAYDGEQALAAVEEFVPDAMLLDLVMPGMSGLEVLRQVRLDEKHAALTIIFLTSRSYEDTPPEVFNAGPNFHCAKPVAPSTLLQKLLDCGVPRDVSDAA